MNNPNQAGAIAFVSRHAERTYEQPVEIVRADRVDEVCGALGYLEGRVARGLHAAGYIAYEAAPAFDPALTCHNGADVGMPLLWFGIYDHATLSSSRKPPAAVCGSAAPWKSLIDENAYRAALEQIRRLIAAGDTYQVNYTFPLESTFREDPYIWFRTLSAAQNADFAAHLNLGRHRILSASPELFFRLDGNTLETRPMKGTRPRGLWPAADRLLARELAQSPKDRAENVMIVDLLRNDMGRVSEAGSVCVQRLFEVERYETIWQMTSTVTSWTRASVPDILGALFPGTARYHVGSGVTWDSNARDEYSECVGKAQILTHHRPEFELLESLLFDGEYFLISRHLERLGASADYFGFQLDMAAVHAVLTEDAAVLRDKGSGPRKVRLLLARDGSVRTTCEPAKPSTPVRIGFAVDPIDESDVFLYHKTTHRGVYDSARASRPDCDDVILWNRRDEITETTVANIVLELDGELRTPHIDSGLLGGVMRAELLHSGKLSEARLTKEDVRRAGSIQLINSVRKWVDAKLVD
ncbi:MAG: chorismate-binding protein [Candidatus Hydrogenedentes bacterium]|nr:chorismate-binding protein [Candidatus Hydrogenedentota bacterium]